MEHLRNTTDTGVESIECELKRFGELSLEELYSILKLRSEIFVVEQDCVYQDMDGKDFKARHMLLKDDGMLVAYLRILPEGVSYDEMAIGRVVVRKDFRGRGISRRMMENAIDFIVNDWGMTKSGCPARHTLWTSMNHWGSGKSPTYIWKTE